MAEIEKALKYLEKSRGYTATEPDKCLIYIERAIQELKQHKRKMKIEIPF